MDLSEAESLAHSLLDEHGLTHWNFAFDRSRRRFGLCAFAPRRRISLSRVLTELNPQEEVRDVVLHEIAHALAGPRAGHGPRWRDVAVSLGADPRRTYDDADVMIPVPAFLGTCPECGMQVRRHRRDRTACRACCNRSNGGRFDERFCYRWSRTAAGG